MSENGDIKIYPRNNYGVRHYEIIGLRIDPLKTFECGQIFGFGRGETLLFGLKKNNRAIPRNTNDGIGYRIAEAVRSYISENYGIKKAFPSEADSNGSDTPIIYCGDDYGRFLTFIFGPDGKIAVFSDKTNNLKDTLAEFFRIHDNYEKIKEEIGKDPVGRKAAGFSDGLRLLLQYPFKCSIAYVLSQRSNIPRITRNLTDLAREFGYYLDFPGGRYYVFPEYEEFVKNDIERIGKLPFGYRSEYVINLLKDFPGIEEKIRQYRRNFGTILTERRDNGKEAAERLDALLLSVKGIGRKVADCIRLFAAGDTSVFPTDVWIARFMRIYYGDKAGSTPRAIREFGQNLFGIYSGYAQEFIFYYARSLKVGKNSSEQRQKRKR